MKNVELEYLLIQFFIIIQMKKKILKKNVLKNYLNY